MCTGTLFFQLNIYQTKMLLRSHLHDIAHALIYWALLTLATFSFLAEIIVRLVNLILKVKHDVCNIQLGLLGFSASHLPFSYWYLFLVVDYKKTSTQPLIEVGNLNCATLVKLPLKSFLTVFLWPKKTKRTWCEHHFD